MYDFLIFVAHFNTLSAAVEDLEKQGVGIKSEDKNRIITNLLTLISSENEGQASDQVTSHHRGHYMQF